MLRDPAGSQAPDLSATDDIWTTGGSRLDFRYAKTNNLISVRVAFGVALQEYPDRVVTARHRSRVLEANEPPEVRE